MVRITVEIDEDWKAKIEGIVKDYNFATISAYIRNLIRIDLKQKNKNRGRTTK